MMIPTLRPDAHYRTPKGGQAECYDEQGIGGVSNFILPQSWTRITLEDVAEWSSGGTPSRSVPSYFTGSIPWIKTGELGEKYLYDAEEKISEEAINNSSAKVFPKGSIALAMYGATIGKLSIFAIKASTNQACAVAIPISEIIDTLFLFYFLHFQRQAFVDAGKGGAQPNISQGIIKAWPFNLPPRNEQTRIVEKLEELLSDLDAGVAELKAAQKKLTQYRQSLLKAAVEGTLTAEWRAERAKCGEPLETGAQLLERILAERRRRWEEKQLAKFKEQGKTPPKDWRDKYPEPVKPNTAGLPELPEGWVWATIGQIAHVGTGVTPLRSNSAYFDGGSIPWVTSGALNSETVSVASEFITESALKKCRLEIYPKNSLLVAMYGEGKTRGKCAELLIPATINQAIAAIVLEPEAIRCKEYLKVFLLNSYEKMRQQASGGVQPNLNLQIIKSIPFPLPPQTEQREIDCLLETQFEQIAAQQFFIINGLKQSSAQRQNILKAAFSGQLVPQDPNDEPASVLLERIRAERAVRESGGGRRGRKAREDAA